MVHLKLQHLNLPQPSHTCVMAATYLAWQCILMLYNNIYLITLYIFSATVQVMKMLQVANSNTLANNPTYKCD